MQRRDFEPDICRKILEPGIFDQWGILMSESVIGSNKVKCPFKDCTTLIMDEANHHGNKSMIDRKSVV